MRLAGRAWGLTGGKSRSRRPVLPRWGKVALPVVGAGLIWSSLGFVGYATGWTVHQHQANDRLVAQVTAGGHATSTGKPSTTTSPAAPCVQAPPQVGQLAGVLTIPSLGLQAPVEEGTDDAELSVAAGHAPASVWPGATGTSVLLAHDVSYFVHLGDLKTGDLVVYRNQCTTVTFRVTGQQVVTAGAPVYNSATPTLVLDTCWPTNALFYTSQRLLVSAAEVPSTAGTGSSTAPSAPPAGSLQPPKVGMTVYTTPAPPDLVAQGLTLTQNEAPMGTMTLTGDTSSAWEESPGPMSLTSAALQAYFGGIHAAEQSRTDWWSAVAPGVVMPVPLTGATITGHGSALDVAVNSVGGTPSTVTLTTEVTVSGGASPGTYNQAVTLGISGSVVTIQTWGMTNA